MSSGRRAQAPRLIEWTGERCVPWAPGVELFYEHLHRYLWAAALVRGRRVLDLASGEGFGAAVLADSAQSVVGVDIDERTVEHSRLNYGRPNLNFARADALALSAFEDRSFDAVVAFEMIEHIEDQERVLAEIARVLDPSGLLIISTPERDAYADSRDEPNPFHARELALAEFVQLLEGSFAHVATWGQRTITASGLSALDQGSRAGATPAESLFVERAGNAWRLVPGVSPQYVVAIASNAELPAVPPSSVLADSGRAAAEPGLAVTEELRRELAVRANEVTALRELIEGLREQAARDADALAVLAAARRAIEESITWRLSQRVRRTVLALIGGERSRFAQVLNRLMRRLGRWRR